jgi:peptidoglycan/LPS O-acetylase OafA/YrhL
MQTPSQTVPSRIPSLDGLRALSILIVLVGHAALSDGAPRLLRPFAHAGNVGVRFFFVISGFLITTLLLQEWHRTGRISLARFYARRALRIFPAVYALIAVIAVLAATGLIHLKPGELLYASTFTINYHDYAMFWLGQLWSLAVEEQFYLLWPGLLVLAALFGNRRGNFRAAWVLAWAVVLGSPLLRAWLWFALHADDTAMTKHFETVMDALALGCLLAAHFNHLGASPLWRRLQSNAALFLGTGIALVVAANAVFLVQPATFYILGQSVANLGTAMCIDWAIRHPAHPVGRLLNWRPIVAVGVASYSLYLWQNPFLLGDAGTPLNRFPLNLVCTAVMATASYFLIEKPCLALKPKPSPQGAP